MEKIKIGILGYGNLGRGVELSVSQNPDMELVGVFTRRDPSQLTLNTKGAVAYHIDQASEMRDKIDVLILCGGSALCNKCILIQLYGYFFSTKKIIS